MLKTSPRKARALSCLLLLALIPQARGAAPAEAEVAAPRYAFLPALMSRVRETFEVPGLAVAVIENGRLQFIGGSGLREQGKPGEVDGDTLFAIASITKGFTATLVHQLADEGRLSLDDRVIDHLPQFRLADPYITRELRVRDLLGHRSGLGLGAGDLLFWPASEYRTEEIVERLADVPLAHGLRERYAYANAPFAVAQLLIEKLDGRSYLEALRQRILIPAGLDASLRLNADALRPDDSNVATGHAKADFSTLQPVVPMTWSNNAAAGGLYASARGLAEWARIQLDQGRVRGAADGSEVRLLSAEAHARMWEMQTPISPRPSGVPALQAVAPQFAGYAQGWSLAEYRGEKLVWHSGGWPGMVSRLTLVPSRKLGVVVLTNQESGAAFNALTYSVLDAALDASGSDWVAAFAEAQAQAIDKADQAWASRLAAHRAETRPSLSLADYAGEYQDPWYGTVSIALQDGALHLRFSHTPALQGRLEHWQHDTFLVRWQDRTLNADAFARFALDADGKVESLRMEAASTRTDFSFDFHDLRLTPVPAEPR